MEIRVIDFEIITKSYQSYVEGYKQIESEKRNMLNSVDTEKKEIEAIIRRSQSGIVMDETSQKRDGERFRQLQDKLMKLDMEFKTKLKNMNDDLNTKIFDELSVIVSEWATANSIDLVTGKMEVIFNSEKIDATAQILEVIKSKNLFYEEPQLVEEPIQEGPTI
jgi:Skp family chaperone for outer membrane proteins